MTDFGKDSLMNSDDEKKGKAILLHGGRISPDTAKKIREFMSKAKCGEIDEVLMVELPPGCKYKIVDFDPDSVITELEIVEKDKAD